MADMNAILDALRDGIARDPDVAAWSELTYGQAHHVFVGLDEKDPPKSSEYPAVLIHPTDKAAGEDEEHITHGIAIETGVYDEAKETLPDINVTEMLGVKRSESFRKLVEAAALTAADSLGLRPSSLRATYSGTEIYPYFLASMELSFVQPTTMGMDMFE